MITFRSSRVIARLAETAAAAERGLDAVDARNASREAFVNHVESKDRASSARVSQ